MLVDPLPVQLVHVPFTAGVVRVARLQEKVLPDSVGAVQSAVTLALSLTRICVPRPWLSMVIAAVAGNGVAVAP